MKTVRKNTVSFPLLKLTQNSLEFTSSILLCKTAPYLPAKDICQFDFFKSSKVKSKRLINSCFLKT